MKKLFVFLTMMVLATSASAQNYDFSAVCESGQTLYYRILSEQNQEVKVTFPNNNPIGWSGYARPEGDLVIPEFVEHEGITYTVVALDNNALDECQGITSVELPNTIRRIGAEAFWYCTGISNELVIPDQCTFIGGYAFMGCSAISALTIGASVDTIQYSAFEDCTSLQSIHCNTPTPPFAEHIPTNPYYEDRSIFNNVPTDIPVFVSCLTIDQFLMSQDWSRFTNMQGVFVDAPELSVSVNDPDLGTAEIVSVPTDCDELTATVRAIPNEGHRFGCWKRGNAVVSYAPEYTFTLHKDCSLTAYFDITYVMIDSIGYPTHVIGRKINNEGVVTNEYPSDFIYSNEGVMTNFNFPGTVSTYYQFAHYPSRPSYFRSGFSTYPYIYEEYSFNYNNYNQIEHSYMFHYGSGDDYGTHYYYYYDNEKRLTKKEYINDEGCFQRFFYAYSDGNRTRTDSVVNIDPYSGNVYKRVQTTNHFNQRNQILTAQTDNYNGSGEITSSTLKTYSYTNSHKTDSVITQTLTDGEWVNSSLTHYVYDNKKRVIELQTASWSVENEDWNITNKSLYDYDDENQKLIISFRKKSGDNWVWDTYSKRTLFYDSELYEWQRACTNYNSYNINQFEIDLRYDLRETAFADLSEWYYEIEWDNGNITYQHLEYATDTTIGTERPKVIVRSNTQYDRDEFIEITHEYILEEGNVVYWWNKDLEEFTTLYDYNAEAGDEWEIKVGAESILVHVDSVGVFEYDGDTRKMLHISDAGNIFNGDIVVGYGHMTSFFPEKLMRRDASFTVNGLRCYWVEDALLYHSGDEDCDAIYSEIHGVDEDGPSTPSTGSGTAGALVVYPNPTNGVLTVSVRLPHCDSPTTGQTEYQISNLMGQTLLQGRISSETQQIDISTLPAGMYFISVGKQTEKFVVR